MGDGMLLASSGPPELVCSSCEDEWHAACLGDAASRAASLASLEGRPFLCPRYYTLVCFLSIDTRPSTRYHFIDDARQGGIL